MRRSDTRGRTDLLSTLACSASIGPGSTNLLTGAATATVNRVPVLLLPSDTFANRRQGPVMQALEHPLEADLTVNDAFRPLSAYFDRITRPEQLVTSLPEAMRVLLDPAETGAVTLSLHQDVQAEAYDFPPEPLRAAHVACRAQASGGRPSCAPRSAGHPRQRAAACDRRWRRPLLRRAAGSSLSCRPAAESRWPRRRPARARSRAASWPWVGWASRAHARPTPLRARRTWWSASARASSTSRPGRIPCSRTPSVRFVGINLVPRDAHKLGALPLVADAKLGLRALLDALEGEGWRAPAGMARTGARGEGSLGARAERRPRPSRRRAHEPGTAAPRTQRGVERGRTGSWSRPEHRTWTCTSSGTPRPARAA